MEEVTWLLRQEKLNKNRCFQKFEKLQVLSKKFQNSKIKWLETISMIPATMQYLL